MTATDRPRLNSSSKAVKSEDDPANVTVEFGPQPMLRVKPDATARSPEVVLAKSRCSGPGVAFALNRDQFARALSFGLRHAFTPCANGPVFFCDDRRTYVTTTLHTSLIIPAIRPNATAIAVRSKPVIPISEGEIPMPSETNGRGAMPAATEPTSADAIDFMSEAEALRDALGEAYRHAGRLANSLKQLHKQRRVLQSAWSSLKNLRLGS